MLNIDELIILYIILNYQITKRVMHVVSCYLITNLIVFLFFIFIHLLFVSYFELTNAI